MTDHSSPASRLTPARLTTARLVLDKPVLDDCEAVLAYAGDLSVSRWLVRVPHPYGMADAQEFVTQIAPEPGCFAVRERISGPLIGVVGVSPIKPRPGVRTSTADRPAPGAAPAPPPALGLLGYWLGPPFWGRGYTTEAATAVVRYAFAELAMTRLNSGYLAGNEASARVLGKLGFAETGRSRHWNQALKCNCEHIDMALDAADFRANG